MFVDIQLSLEKAYKEHWTSERYWKKYRNADLEKIDWKDIFNNMLNRKAHKVWLMRDASNYDARSGQRYVVV
ncbi:MAG: hypothetical protein LIO93_10250 [Bacteroidales bacterium]|nr:hypothetical protein [Bacteroidales bacterium]